MALADMGRVEDTFPILRSVMEIDTPAQSDKHTFFEEAVSSNNNYSLLEGQNFAKLFFLNFLVLFSVRTTTENTIVTFIIFFLTCFEPIRQVLNTGFKIGQG